MIAASKFLPKLFSFSERARESAAPAGAVLYVVGDVHGRADLLRDLLDKICADIYRNECSQACELILLGDYIDRGPDSRLTIDLILAAGRDRRFSCVTPLRGNHEEALLVFLRNPAYWPAWSRFGARETLLAYGVSPPLPSDGFSAWCAARSRLEHAIPPAHLDFFRGLGLTAIRGDFFCVHAGARPNVPLAQQREQDLLSIRDDFIRNPHAFEKVIVHGHTRGQQPIGPHRIALDSGAYATGVLTAVKLKGLEKTLLQVQGESRSAQMARSDRSRRASVTSTVSARPHSRNGVKPKPIDQLDLR